ncbi:hypothetical protein T492DRAFT_44445 [Pavlovales sp. CCMP2436]|nr:hypothetical protein T492DRAFT_44445 [Pavlovales sp. CCMP2436]
MRDAWHGGFGAGACLVVLDACACLGASALLPHLAPEFGLGETEAAALLSAPFYLGRLLGVLSAPALIARVGGQRLVGGGALALALSAGTLHPPHFSYNSSFNVPPLYFSFNSYFEAGRRKCARTGAECRHVALPAPFLKYTPCPFLKYLEVRPSPDRSPPDQRVEKHSDQGTLAEHTDMLYTLADIYTHIIQNSQTPA